MAAFIHSILRTNAVRSADGDEVFDLPVNPLSVILLHISALNETSTIGNYSLLERLLSAVDNIRITHKGASVFDASGIDAAAIALLWHKIPIWQSNAVETDNDRRSLVIPILFGRKAYDPLEAFPETKKGELQMSVTWDIADAGFDGLRRSIETIELPDANPAFVQKVTTLAQTFAATGQNEIDLPIGNLLRAILMFGTTGYAGATPAPSLGEVQVLVDNRQVGYSATDFEVLRSVMGLIGTSMAAGFRHIHSLNGDVVAADATDLASVLTLANEIKTDLNDGIDVNEPELGSSLDDNYVLVPFDVTGDDLYSLETEGKGRVHIRIDAETADAVRIMPIERVNATMFTG